MRVVPASKAVTSFLYLVVGQTVKQLPFSATLAGKGLDTPSRGVTPADRLADLPHRLLGIIRSQLAGLLACIG
jgi:hypothetical protein